MLGWVWPFLVAALGIAIVSTGRRLSDFGAQLLLSVSFLGIPAVFLVVMDWLPSGWSGEARRWTAVPVAAAIVFAEVVVAVYAFIHGANLTGYGWIE